MTESKYRQRIEALRALTAENRPGRRYFVDFDYTLILANSTDLLINSAEPRALYWPVMKAMGALKPWAFKGADNRLVHRDPMRAKLITRIAPGLFERFSSKAGQLYIQHKNRLLNDILSPVSATDIYIVSFGLTEILDQLLQGTRFEASHKFATTLDQMSSLRAAGKVNLLKQNGISLNHAKDVVITDSATDDADLLAAVEHGFHIEWHKNG